MTHNKTVYSKVEMIRLMSGQVLKPPQEVIILLPAPVTEMPVCCCVLVWSDGLQLRLNRRAAPVFWACCCNGGADGRMDGWTDVRVEKKNNNKCARHRQQVRRSGARHYL